MKKTMLKIKAFAIWQQQAEAKWLDEMAAQGWKLIKVLPYLYWFEQAEKEQCFHCHDCAVVKPEELENYLQIYQDAGWTLVTRYKNWFYFKSASNTPVYSDEHSLTVKNINISKEVMVMAALFIVIGIVVAAVGHLGMIDLVSGFGVGLTSASVLMFWIAWGLSAIFKRKLEWKI